MSPFLYHLLFSLKQSDCLLNSWKFVYLIGPPAFILLLLKWEQIRWNFFIKHKIINTAMTPIFITSLPLTVCGVKGESGFCQRLSVCMYATLPLLHCMAKRKFIHISRHWHWPIRTGGKSKNTGGPKVNDGFLFLVLLSFLFLWMLKGIDITNCIFLKHGLQFFPLSIQILSSANLSSVTDTSHVELEKTAIYRVTFNFEVNGFTGFSLIYNSVFT